MYHYQCTHIFCMCIYEISAGSIQSCRLFAVTVKLNVCQIPTNIMAVGSLIKMLAHFYHRPLCVCLSVCICLWLTDCLSLSVFDCLSMCLSVCDCPCLSVYDCSVLVCVSVTVSVCLSMTDCVCLCMTMSLFVYYSACLSVWLLSLCLWLTVYACLCPPMTESVCICLPVTVSVSVCLSVTVYDLLCLSMTVYDLLCLSMTVWDCVWLTVSVCDYPWWLCLSVFNCLCLSLLSAYDSTTVCNLRDVDPLPLFHLGKVYLGLCTCWSVT